MNIAFTCKEFTITQSNTALKIGTDAFILGSYAEFQNPNSILDIGTGSGILSLMLAQKYPSAQIHAIDIDEGAIKDASHNFNVSKWKNNLHAKQISIQKFAQEITFQFDLIISNPPFFINSQLSGNTQKDNSRHAITLIPADLINCASKCMHIKSELWIIIPVSEKLLYISEALNNDLFPIKEILIKPFEDSPPNRNILCFSKTSKSIFKEEIAIRKDTEEYTTQYKELTKNYYLKI